MKSQLGPVKIKIPRDRNGAFEPKVLPKYHRNADGVEEKVLNLYAAGMTTRDISAQVRDLYGVEISAEFVSKVTDKLLPEMNEWQSRPLDAVYPFIFMDAIHYKIRDNHTIQTKAAYVVLGVNMEGRKDILGIGVGEHEGAKFWMGVLNDLKARGMQDVYLCCVDGLKDFVEAIEAVYPHSQVQRCIVHQMRASCNRPEAKIATRLSHARCYSKHLLYVTDATGEADADLKDISIMPVLHTKSTLRF